jgi:hypothetical protein
LSYWAKIDENNLVLEVIYFDNEVMNDEESKKWIDDNLEGKWLQTSYNSSIRKNYAGIGFYYDEDLDAFIPPKPEGDDWELNLLTGQWENEFTKNFPVVLKNSEDK